MAKDKKLVEAITSMEILPSGIQMWSGKRN